MGVRLDQLLVDRGADRWVVVTGGPGMGKSTILTAWLVRWEAAGAAVPHHFTPVGAIDVIEAHVRSWLTGQPAIPQPLCDAVRGALRDLITNVQAANDHNPRTTPVGAILQQATRTTRDNERPPPPPHLRI